MKSFIKNWLVPLLALAAIALLIWFIGPLLAIGEWQPLDPELNRWILIAAVVLGWAIRRLVAALSQRKHERAMLAGVSEAKPDPAAQASAEEVATLGRRLEEALGVLKKARLGGKGEQQTLYQLPWYILIGPPGSGKTTALVNCGLNFPLAEQFGKGAIGGVGGTRNCDWWFTDEAVLLDTAGRYTTQDSDAAVDQAGWLGFLDLLKKHRRRRPISGALIAISVADLLTGSEAERSAHARAIRARVEELHQRLGIRFPIYVLLTKSDLVAGFTEFFDDLGREERQQVWGMTFPLATDPGSDTPLAGFAGEFDQLEARLSARLTERLQAERDPARRALLYGFPKNFLALRELLGSFLDEAFRPSAYAERPLLRGVYFTSGTQEGTPIDRLMASMAGGFGLGRQQLTAFSGGGRSYFLTRLFRETIFPEQGLAGTNLKLERRRAWLQRGAWAAVALVTLSMAGLWVNSYRANQALIAEVDADVTQVRQKLEALSAEQRDVLYTLPLLDAVRALPGGYAERKQGAPLTMGFGLYQGDMLGSEAQLLYRKLLRGVLLPRLTLRLEAQLRQPGAAPDFLYEGLKTYLMLEDPDHYDPAAIKAWITFDWDTTLPRDVTQEQRAALRAHLDALFEKRPLPLPLALDRTLIAQVRAQLVRLPMAKRVYNRLQRVAQQSNLPELRIVDAAGRDASLVLVRRSGKPLTDGVPGFWTLAGYDGLFRKSGAELAAQLAAESWVLGDDATIAPQDVPQLATDVRTLYLRDYQTQWENMLADVGVVSFGNTQQALDILRVLSGPNSPLKKWLETVATQTNLVAADEKSASGLAAKAADGAIDKLKQQLGSLIGQSDVATPSIAQAPQIDPVTARFADIAALVAKDQSGSAPIDRLLASLNNLFEKMNTLATTSGDALIKDAAAQVGQAASRLKLDADRAPPAIGGALKGMADGASQLTMGGVRTQLNAIWQSEVVDFYRASLAGRYPLSARSSREATLDDFGQFFGPGGRLDSFFKTYLASYVDQSTKPWRWQPNAPEKLGISAGVLVQFQNADAIREAFFRPGAQTPSVRLELRPITMDAEITQFLIDFDGQQLSYDHGPVRAAAMQWPSPNGIGTVRITINPPGLSGRSGLTYEGTWGLFHMLDQQGLSRGSERFTLNLEVDGRSASFELRAGSAFNPFRLRELTAFSLPDRL